MEFQQKGQARQQDSDSMQGVEYGIKGYRSPGEFRVRGKSPYKGSKSPGIGYLYVLLIMFIAIVAGNALSGGAIPVDPNGPGGPPTLPPYYGADGDADQQQIILPSEVLQPDGKKSLQLQTFQVKSCAQTTVVDLLVDTSGSMKDAGKLGKLKDALTQATKRMSRSSVVGMQTFSAVVKERVPLDYYRNNKAALQANINGLSADGWTRTRDGMNAARTAIVDAKSKNKFPGYKYTLVLLTDGVPELATEPRTCIATAPDPDVGTRCFAKEQDPRVPSNIAAELKQSGVEIYTIGIYSPQYASDKALMPYLQQLLKELASGPDHYFDSVNATDLKSVLDKIFTTICNQNITETGDPQQIMGPGQNPLLPVASPPTIKTQP